MIQVNGERYRVVRLACGYLFRLKPETNKFTNNGEVINYGQLIGLVDCNFLESEMSRGTGGPAFPTPATEWHGNDEGMTLRDYFAARAMQSLVQVMDGSGAELACERAYAWADAMLEARNKQ